MLAELECDPCRERQGPMNTEWMTRGKCRLSARAIFFPATEWACRRLRTSVPNVRYRRIVLNTLSKTTSVMACGAAVLNVNGRGSCAIAGVTEESRSADERAKARLARAASWQEA